MPRLLLIAGLLAALGLAGCRARTPTPGGAQGSKPDAARKQAESLAAKVAAGSAEALVREHPELARLRFDKTVTISTPATNDGGGVPPGPDHARPPAPAASQAGVQEPPQPKSAPRPGPPPVIKERVVSALAYQNEPDAEEDAVNAACDLVQHRLAELDPPVKYRPSANELKNEFLRRDSRTTRNPTQAEREMFEKHLNLTAKEAGNLKYVEFDVEVTADQVRELRTRDRVGQTLRVLGGLTAAALAAFLFLRFDEWTKGYLTRWLAAAAVLFAGGAAAALYFV